MADTFCVDISWLPQQAADHARKRGLVFWMCASCGNTRRSKPECPNCDVSFREYVDMEASPAGSGPGLQRIYTQRIPVYPAMLCVNGTWRHVDRDWLGWDASHLADYQSWLDKAKALAATGEPLNERVQAVLIIESEVIQPLRAHIDMSFKSRHWPDVDAPLAIAEARGIINQAKLTAVYFCEKLGG